MGTTLRPICVAQYEYKSKPQYVGHFDVCEGEPVDCAQFAHNMGELYDVVDTPLGKNLFPRTNAVPNLQSYQCIDPFQQIIVKVTEGWDGYMPEHRVCYTSTNCWHPRL